VTRPFGREMSWSRERASSVRPRVPTPQFVLIPESRDEIGDHLNRFRGRHTDQHVKHTVERVRQLTAGMRVLEVFQAPNIEQAAMPLRPIDQMPRYVFRLEEIAIPQLALFLT